MALAVCDRVRLGASASALVLAFVAGPVFAQVEPTSSDVTAVADIIVTAQKREQSIQDVPIAVTALSAESLDAMKIEGGSELMRAIPNVSFSKNNFSMYNFSIRGIGTKSISAASDPAVAVSFNNSPLIRNRLFEQEYLDVNRVEVLRGPQGTLYGRNATAGVVNMIPNLPGPNFDAMLKAETGNYATMRGQMMVNIPLTDTFWVRAAGALTKREGFDHNTFLDSKVNGRDLFTTRLSALWEPNDRFSANFIWEHFGEDDNRSRTGKQLCTTDPGPSKVGNFSITSELTRARLSQGCEASSLYGEGAFGTPNGLAMSQLYAATFILGYTTPTPGPTRKTVYSFKNRYVNPYEGVVQSRDLREISTAYDPKFRADNDVYQLNVSYDLSDTVKLFSQTLYTRDDYYSTQDYGRFVSNEIFSDSNDLYDTSRRKFSGTMSPGGYYDDPQLGPSSRILMVDLSQSKNRQWSQEFRAQSNSDGNFNFNVGVNYLDFKTQDDYYVFNNLFSYLAEYFYNVRPGDSQRNSVPCEVPYLNECIYVDQNRLSSISGDGHNYFRSKNVVHTRSWALFGEGYWNLQEDLRLTLGLRYTDDKKVTTPYPSQLLLGAYPDGSAPGAVSGGFVHRGLPALPDITQRWDAVTGRAVLDWKPVENVLLYASYARGYKGGGSNPPRADINPEVVQYQSLPELFAPEYVNSFEVGVKSSMNDGRVRLNATAFYYDYKDYQVSQIVDRISLNENFDAESMGLELELVYQPTRNFRVDANIGLLKTKVGSGEKSIDVMNRTQGDPNWTVVRPWVQVPSNCIAPTNLVEKVLASPFYTVENLTALCTGSQRIGSFNPEFPSSMPLHLLFGFEYDPMDYEEINGGRGIYADLGGNELPNSPRITANIGAQYSWSIMNWDVTIRGDYYRQSESYFRIYNTEYDKLKGWDNLNVALTASDFAGGLSVQVYVKNLFDDAPIVDAFTNSDDSMLTTNVFTLDPRIIGLSLSKKF